MNADFSGLFANIKAVIHEFQLKIGFAPSSMALNYPFEALARLMRVQCERDAMPALLQAFCDWAEDRLGRIDVTADGDIYTLTVPPQGTQWVHEQPDNGFLKAFLEDVSKPSATPESLHALFLRFSDRVVFERTQNDEFDYLLRFEDEEIDPFCYCLKPDLGHMTYHRYTRQEYESFGF